MCLVIFACQVHPRYPLLVAANRDEFHDRPTEPAAFWREWPQLLAGRDVRLGGTWMGMTRAGKFAAVTNFRDPEASAVAPRSRGELPLNYLLGSSSPEDYLAALQLTAGDYAGFNLVLGDANDLWYYSNSKSDGGENCGTPRHLQPGIYGLSNAFLDTPWPKVECGKSRLRHIVEREQIVDHPLLFSLVSNTALAEPAALHSRGLGSEMEHMLSAQFIQSATYGTRSSTTAWIDREGAASWRELSFDSAGAQSNRHREDFRLTGSLA